MRWWALALVVAILLAGCGGKSSGVNKVKLGDGNRISLDLPEGQQPDPDGIHGAISGVVVNDAIYPLPDASIVVKGWNGTGVSDADGRFVFERVPPGLFVLEVTKDGHSTGLATVNVKSGQVTKSVIMAPRLPFVEPYHLTQAFDEFASQFDNVFAQPTDHVVALDGGPATLIVEAIWDDITVVDGDPLTYSIKPERSTDPPVTGTGTAPLRVQLDADAFDRDEYAVRVDVGPNGVAVPVESSGRIFVTAFYVEPAPSGWSFVGGDE